MGYDEIDRAKYRDKDFYEEVVGLLASYTESKQSFCRVGLAEVQKKVLETMDLQSGARGLPCPLDVASDDALCSPTVALAKSDVIDGVDRVVCQTMPFHQQVDRKVIATLAVTHDLLLSRLRTALSLVLLTYPLSPNLNLHLPPSSSR